MKIRHLIAALATGLCILPAAAQQKVAAAAPGPASGPQAALAATAGPSLSTEQLEIAQRVHLGRADCEFNQHVTVDPIDGRPGHFRVAFKSDVYTMVPQATSTGAVRLEDSSAGVIWLQIANKSMLMNSKAGRRVADACMHAEQRSHVANARPTGPSLLGPR